MNTKKRACKTILSVRPHCVLYELFIIAVVLLFRDECVDTWLDVCLHTCPFPSEMKRWMDGMKGMCVFSLFFFA